MGNKPFKVERQYRTHPDSKTDGGVTVVVEFKDGRAPREYPDVKNPDRFIDAIFRNDKGGKVARCAVKGTAKAVRGIQEPPPPDREI